MKRTGGCIFIKWKVILLSSNLTPVSILDKLSYNAGALTVDTATKIGNLVHIHGTATTTDDIGISISDFSPKENFVLPCLNYNGWNSGAIQAQVIMEVSESGILIRAANAPYTYTVFDVWYVC